jgi:hypothetical protein
MAQPLEGEDAMPIRDEGFALLRERLVGVVGDSAAFETLWERLRKVLEGVLERIERDGVWHIERVLARGDWVQYGIDVRNLPYEEVILLFVLTGSERSYSSYQQIAGGIFGDLQDEDVFVQFQLMTAPEWCHAQAAAGAQGQERALGIELWSQ